MTDILRPTTNGVIYNKNGKEIFLEIPNFQSLNISSSGSNYHFYDETHTVGSSNRFSTNYVSSSNIIWNNIREEPAPTFGIVSADIPISSGSVTDIPGLGSVTSYIFEEHDIVVNVTNEGDHALYPGIVVRDFFLDGNQDYKIRTTGIGNGFNAFNLNEGLADFVWGNNSERIKRESIFEDNSAQEPNLEPVPDLSVYNNSSFSSTFSSLGYSNDFVSDFNNLGWGSLGGSNDQYNDFTYDFGGNNYTIFGSDSTISLPTTPRSDNDLWGNPSGSFAFNPKLSFVDAYSIVQNRISPLSFDLDGDGIETTALYDTSVFFDIDGDGFAEKVGWIGPDDGQLAIDTNGDGIINDITELFGDDIMPAYDKLALYDSNGDGVINDQDDDYANLLVWRDINQDGYSDANELFALTDPSIQIKEISLAEQPLDLYDNENYISGSSSFTRYDNTTGTMYDVHFLNDNLNTWFLGARSEQFGSTYEVSPEALLMPLSRGYGSLASLHIAMTDNLDLREIMRDLVALDIAEFDQLSAKMEAFLYEWAGVTDNDPDARKTGNGSNVDARKVDFLEEFTGVEWKQMGVADLVGSKASIGVKKIWTEIENLMSARILVQGALKDEVFQNATYDFVTDSLTLGDTMADLIARAQDYVSGADDTQAHDFWLSIGNIFVMHKDELGVSITEITDALDAAYGQPLYIGEKTITAEDGEIYSAIDGSDEQLTVNTYVGTDDDDVIRGSNANDYIFGAGGKDEIYGRGGDDYIRGDDQDDVIEAGDGDDRAEGNGGNDTLIGGDGRDDLRGGDGVDTLIGGDGQDKLHGGAGADIIDGGKGADEIDYLESDAAVYVNLATRQLQGGHAEGDVFSNVENLTGSDFSDVLIGDGQANLINGERGDDIMMQRAPSETSLTPKRAQSPSLL